MHRLAIYDMDTTITRKATFLPFLLHVIRTCFPWRALRLPAVALVSLGYALGLIDRARLKEINLGLIVGRRIDNAQLHRMAASFAVETMWRNVRNSAIAALEHDRANGWRLVMATASYGFYVEEIARHLKMDDVIATKTTPLDSAVTSPAILGENCYGDGKLRMIQAWLSANGIARDEAEIRFYSDHYSDSPTFEWCDEPVAANPHAPLRKLARARGWLVIDWD